MNALNLVFLHGLFTNTAGSKFGEIHAFNETINIASIKLGFGDGGGHDQEAKIMANECLTSNNAVSLAVCSC